MRTTTRTRLAQRRVVRIAGITGLSAKHSHTSPNIHRDDEDRQQADDALLRGHLDVGVVHATDITGTGRSGTRQLVRGKAIRDTWEEVGW